MIVDLSKPLLSVNGEPIFDKPVEQGGKPATLATFVIDALCEADQKDASGDEKMKRFRLALQVEATKSNCKLSVDDLALIKRLVGSHFKSLVVGRIWEALETAQPEATA